MDYDAPAKTALDTQEVIKPRWYAWLDILGDPVRATTGPADVTFPGSVADPDLKNQTFEAYHPEFVAVSEVKHAVGGGSTVTASLSGLLLIDNALMNIIANPVNWQGRVARFWQGIHNQANVQQGAVVPYHGGYMSALEIEGSPSDEQGNPGGQTISVVIESYTASLSRGSGRTYMDQSYFDPGDLSAAAALAAANNAEGQGGDSGSGGGTGTGVGGGGYGGMLGGFINQAS